MFHLYNTYIAENNSKNSQDSDMAVKRFMTEALGSASLCFKATRGVGLGFKPIDSHSGAGWLQRNVVKSQFGQLSLVDPKVSKLYVCNKYSTFSSFIISMQQFIKLFPNCCRFTSIYVIGPATLISKEMLRLPVQTQSIFYSLPLQAQSQMLEKLAKFVLPYYSHVLQCIVVHLFNIYIFFVQIKKHFSKKYIVILFQVEDLITPLAWKSGETFSIVGKCSVSNLEILGSAFLRNDLHMEEGSLQLDEISSKRLC